MIVVGTPFHEKDIYSTFREKEKRKVTGKIDTNLTEQPPDLFKDLEDLNKTIKDMDEAAKELEKSGMGLETDMKKLKEATDELKKSIHAALFNKEIYR